jgi:hypothetical protein
MSNLQSPSEAKPIQLQWGDGQVVITPADQDRFVKEAKWAVAACQGFMQFEKFFKKFTDEFLAQLRAWCERNSDRVAACYVPFAHAQGGVHVYMIAASNAFDFQLSEMISELEQALDNDGWSADILQLPQSSPEMLSSFFEPSRSILVYGNGSGTSSEGEPQSRLS